MKTKRFLSAAMALAVVITMAGCQEAKTSTPDTSKDNSSAVTENSTVTESTQSKEEQSKEENSEAESSAPETTTTENKGGNDKPVGVDGVVTNGQVAVTIDGHRWGISLYGGGTGENYAKYLNEFKEKVGSNVNVFNMVVPTASAFYLPAGYEEYNASHRDSINSIANNLVNVINIDGYAALEAKTDEYIYTRTDHHWMPLGAYYAAKQFCDSQKLTISPLSKYRKATYGGYVGSMYYYSQDYNLYNDPEDYDVYYSPNEDKLTTTYYNRSFGGAYEGNLFMCNDASYYYLSFLGSDDLIAHVKTDAKNGRNLVVIKESYGNALIPFLTEAFENIYVIDLRYCNVNAIKFCKDVDATDLLFANCAYTVAGGNCEYFSYIRNI